MTSHGSPEPARPPASPPPASAAPPPWSGVHGPSSGPSHSRELAQIRRAVVACFLLSGAVGLIYEVLWIRMLGLVFGHTVFAVTTVLASFMGGLGVGSYLFGRIADRSAHLLRLYGLLEIGIGLYCLGLPLLLEGAAALSLGISRSLDPPFLVFSLIQFTLVAGLLVPPTCLMGATLPVLVRFFAREEQSLGRQVGLLYSLNTFGAVLGVLLAGYALVPLLGIRTTLLLAVVTNLGLGTLVCVFDRHLRRLGTAGPPAGAPAGPAPPDAPPPAALPAGAAWSVAAGFACSGAASMVYEVTWSRALSLSLGSSTYAFTAMLVAFLAGIALGSWAFALLAGRRPLGVAAFGWLQLAIGLCALALVPAFGRLPAWFLRLFQLSQTAGFVQGLQFALSLAMMLVPTLLVGATFPCAVRILSRGLGRLGHDTGWIYAVNTAGAILGTVLAGFLAVPTLGIQATMRLGVGLNLAVGAVILLVAAPARRPLARMLGPAVAAAGLLAVAWLPPWDPAVMVSGVAIYGRQYLPLLRAGEFSRPDWQPEVVFYRDGISGTVSVHRDGPRVTLRVNGKTDAGNAGDMHTQLFSGHIPLLLHPDPKRVLVIGLGSGVTAGAVAQYPVERIDVIEIEPAVVAAARFFEAENRRVLADPRVRMIVADGRNFLLNTTEPYDVIISEPSNPWIRGLATLFTREFFALARSRLARDGIMLQWIQGYGLAPEDLRMVAETFRTAFPEASFWNTTAGDNFLVGTPGPLQVPLAAIQARFDASAALREDFARVGLQAPAGLLADLLLRAEELARFAAGSDLNTDDTLRLEFSAPRSLYEVGLAETNDRILQSYRTAAPLPLAPADRALLETAPARDALGRAFLAKGLPREAEAEFSRAARLDPAHRASRLAEARLLLQRGLVLRGMGELERLLGEPESEAEAARLLAQAYRQQGLPEAAHRAAERAARTSPAEPAARLALAELWRELGEPGRAEAEYEALRRARPADPALLVPLAELRLLRGAPQDVPALLAPLAEAGGGLPRAVRAKAEHLRGAAYLNARRLPQAVAALRTAVRLNPVDAGARLDLSLALEGSGALDEARIHLERLLALEPDHLAALHRLTGLLARLERGA